MSNNWEYVKSCGVMSQYWGYDRYIRRHDFTESGRLIVDQFGRNEIGSRVERIR
jgi:hypothetical protein